MFYLTGMLLCFLLIGVFVIRQIIVNGSHSNNYPAVVGLYIMLAFLLLFEHFGPIYLEEGTYYIALLIATMLFTCLWFAFTFFYLRHFSFLSKRSVLLFIPFSLGIVWTFGKIIYRGNPPQNFPLWMIALGLQLSFVLLIYVVVKRFSNLEKEIYQMKFRRSAMLSTYTSSDQWGTTEEIDNLIVQLYKTTRNKSRSVMRSQVNSILHSYAKSPELSRVIWKRLSDDNTFESLKYSNIIDFGIILLPEVYGNDRQMVQSSSFQNRVVEAAYSMMEQTRMDYKELINRVEKMGTNREDKIGADTIEQQNQTSIWHSNYKLLRELSHTINTPLSTIQLACDWLLHELQGIDYEQREKINQIKNNSNLISSIIYGYRELTHRGESISEPSTSLPSDYITLCLKDLEARNKKGIQFSIMPIPAIMGNYSSNIVSLILMPLVENAYEASKPNEKISVLYEERMDEFEIKIENTCPKPPKNEDLNKEGFSTKADHKGEGLESVRRIASSIGIDFSIRSYSKKQTVTAIIRLPKR